MIKKTYQKKLTPYQELLLSPHWQKKRLEILNRDDWSCTNCGRSEETLHVHHRIYKKGNKPWEYENELLTTLCATCHEEETIISKDMPQIFFDFFMQAGFLPSHLNNIMESGISTGFSYDFHVESSVIGFFLSNVEAQRCVENLYWNKEGFRGESLGEFDEELGF